MDAADRVSTLEVNSSTKASNRGLQEQLFRLGLERDDDNYIVWCKDNPDHPRNWALARKVFDIGTNIVYNLIASASPDKSDGRGD